MADALVTQLARALNLSPDAARHTLNHLVAALREQIDATGSAAVPGLGTFRLDDDDRLAFDPEDALARAVNHRYAGLRPIAASRSVTTPATPEPDDPFEAVDPSAPEESEAPAAAFQPIEAFIEPDAAETDEADAAPLDEAEVTDGEETEPDVAEPSAFEDDPIAEEPIADEPAPEEELAEEDQPVAETALAAEDEDENDEADEVLAGTWVTTSALPEEHTLSDEPAEESDDSAFEQERTHGPEDIAEPEGEEVLDNGIDWAALDTGMTSELDEEATTEDVLEHDSEHDEVAEPDEPEFVEAEGDDILLAEGEDEDDELLDEDPAVFLASEPPPVTEIEPEPHDEPAPEPPVPTVAPAVAATGAAAASRPPVAPKRKSNMRVLGGIAVVLLLALVGLLWALNREPAAPVVAERPPVPADTVAALPPPVDTAAVAVDTAAVATPDPTPPAPSADPLRSSAGIDRADGGFSWIVASEFSREPAERRVAAFREQGFRADVIAEEAAGRTRYRVALGQFTSIDEADRFRSDLPAGVPADTWLLRL